MSEDNNPPVERLDLRFKAVPARAADSWLPGNIWMWFALGIIAGVFGWHFGHQRLSNQLGQQVQPTSSPAEALLALEALDLLDSKDQSHFVSGLSHPDTRVAKSALQMLMRRVDQWPSLDSTLYYAELRTLASLLDSLPRDLPTENRTLIQSLAARLFSTCVSIDDPQLDSVSKVCQLLMTLEEHTESLQPIQTRLASAHSLPPEPLPRFTDTASFQLSDEASESIALSAESQFIDSTTLHHEISPMKQRFASENADLSITAPAIPGTHRLPSTLVSHDASNQPPVSDKGASQESSATTGGRIDYPNQPEFSPELPVLVSTPASIASQPVVRMRVVSNQPDLDGIQHAKPTELVRLLGSQHANVAKGAALSLRHHGFSDAEITLASELAVGSAQRRLELIQQIASSNSIPPQPWLIWMAEDGQPEVRRMSISLLSSMQTDQVQRSLRMLLFRETDQDIKDLIRKVLLSDSNR